jgi:hypothetical protein
LLSDAGRSEIAVDQSVIDPEKSGIVEGKSAMDVTSRTIDVTLTGIDEEKSVIDEEKSGIVGGKSENDAASSAIDRTLTVRLLRRNVRFSR